MIRVIDMDEVEKLSELGTLFFKRLELPGSFNRGVFCENWRRLIAQNMGFILCRFNGGEPVEALGVIQYPDVFSGNQTACNMFWFYKEEPKGLEGGALYGELESYCRNRNIKILFIGVLCNERITKVGGFLLKSGYQLTEMQYRKEL